MSSNNRSATSANVRPAHKVSSLFPPAISREASKRHSLSRQTVHCGLAWRALRKRMSIRFCAKSVQALNGTMSLKAFYNFYVTKRRALLVCVLLLDGTGRIAAGSHEVFPCTIPTANA